MEQISRTIRLSFLKIVEDTFARSSLFNSSLIVDCVIWNRDLILLGEPHDDAWRCLIKQLEKGERI